MFAVNKKTIGILALQGGYEAHARALKTLGVDSVFVKHPGELAQLSGFIIPGGESTTLMKFFEQSPFIEAIRELHGRGGAIFGTCADAILLSKNALGLVNIAVERNAYGRQLASHVSTGVYSEKERIECVFIRAPKITDMGDSVNVLVTCEEEVVCVEENRCLVATFHPELTTDTQLHQRFLSLSLN